jgi:hypothetical protein
VPQNVYSTRFITTKGLSGTGSSYTVPAGLVAVVKEVSITAPLWFGFYGGIVFEPGQGFHFQVNNSFGEAADVSAHGYLLTLP